MIEQLRAAEPAGGSTETIEEDRLPDEAAERLVESLDRSGQTARAEEGGLERTTILELARRLKPDEAINLDQAIKELGNAVGVALDVIATGKRPSNDESFVKDVLDRLAETTKAGRFRLRPSSRGSGFGGA
jgi:hypothetical protein